MKIKNHVKNIKRLNIYITPLINLVDKMRYIWLETLGRALYFYRQAAATAILGCVFKGKIQFMVDLEGPILVGREFKLNTDSPEPLTKKHTATYFDNLVTSINRQQSRFQTLIHQ